MNFYRWVGDWLIGLEKWRIWLVQPEGGCCVHTWKMLHFGFFVNRPKKSSLYDVIENIITFVLNAIMMNIVKSMFLWAPWSVENCWSNSPSLHDISRRGNNGVSWYPRYQKIFWLTDKDYRCFVVNIALMGEMQLFFFVKMALWEIFCPKIFQRRI